MNSMKNADFHSLRKHTSNPREHAAKVFASWITPHNRVLDACWLDARATRVAAVLGPGPIRPLIAAVRSHAQYGPETERWTAQFGNWAILFDADRVRVAGSRSTDELPLSEELRVFLTDLRDRSLSWAGFMTENGDHVFDPRAPSPGTHFRANLLIGDRAGYPHPLLTTPKAVVDEWGRGSSRSHADRQILATRWDMLPEENGFPANRQFYLVENGKQIFYSARPPADANVQTRHSANHTIIRYEMPDGLVIERILFVLAAEQGLPLGVEAQLIRITNGGLAERVLDLVPTGMFGFIYPGALTVDVIYTCITVEPAVFYDPAEPPLVVAPRYTAGWGTEDRPFHLAQLVQNDGSLRYATDFCLDYRYFVGGGTLEQPEHVAALDNRFPAKGPAFFAVRLRTTIPPGGTVEGQCFSGLVSQHEEGPVTDERMRVRLQDFVARAADPTWARRALERVIQTQERYQQVVQIETPDSAVNRLVNVHLPFQVRYQTYVSRSFGLTQKGFRQIGFREIQDLLAGLPFEIGMGRADHVAALIGVWASHVHEFGYADHQFYWTGVEPGRYSDDALWLFQAVARYIDVSGDRSILDREWPIAGTDRKRPLYETLKTILHYSGRVSVGKHGLPLIDHADWNDTLNLDGEGLHGPEKEALYRQQIAQGLIQPSQALQTDLSESVMNGFLLEVARAAMVRFARMRGDSATEQEWTAFGSGLRARLHEAWKGDFFARGYINRAHEHGVTYFGAQGDGLSADPQIPGTYFLNSFSWSVLSEVATDEQIAIMLDRIERYLVTDVGLRLSSPVRFDLLMGRTGSGDYAYGDRENGGVFKHAAMMAVVAMLHAARRVASLDLAERLMRRAWATLQATAPFATFREPFVLAGNPRFCTQYVNPATGEHVGPLLSGTAPWMWMAYMAMMGVNFVDGRIELDPVLPPEWERAVMSVAAPAGRYRIEIRKPPARFVRLRDAQWMLQVAGTPTACVRLPVSDAQQPVPVSLVLA